MRRKHWWGAAAGVGMLAVAGLAAPAAYASFTPATTARTAVVPVKKPVHPGHGDHGHHGHHGHCHYPPHGKPDVAITAPASGHQPSVITGAMKMNNCALDDVLAGLFKFIKGATPHDDQWVRMAEGTTGAQGQLRFAVPSTPGVYRIVTAPGDGLAPGLSRPVTVAPAKQH